MAGRDTGTSGVGTAVGDPVAVDASADETARAQETAPPLPTIAKVPPGAPLDWLRRGWDDLRATRFVGLFYGAVFVAMGYAVVTVYATRWQLTSGLIGGFFLMGPFICAGLYELSRQRARGERGNLLASMLCWRRRPRSIALFAFVLTFAMLVWTRVSLILFALVLDRRPARRSRACWRRSSRPTTSSFVLILWTGVGASCSPRWCSPSVSCRCR